MEKAARPADYDVVEALYQAWEEQAPLTFAKALQVIRRAEQKKT